MKFNVTFDKSIVESGKVDEKVAAKTAEECAEKAFGLGKAQGWLLGGLFVAGAYVALDAVCHFLDDGNKRDRK